MNEEKIIENPMGYEVLRLVESMDKKFDVNHHIYFTRTELLRILDDDKKWNI